MAARGLAAAVSGALIAAGSARDGLSSDFMWGTATAAFQIEGFTKEGGRAPSVWDEFMKPEYGHIKLNATGDPADQDYAFYASKTVPLLQQLGVKHYRMSIAWPRILRGQTAENPAGEVNPEGVEHYHKVIKALRAGGIEPVVTMWHWDTPLELEVAHGGFLSRELMPRFFEEYARVLFREYGSEVRYWITLNEPLTVASQGYTNGGIHAPGRCGDRTKCSVGDDTTEPYAAAHTMLLSHARAVKAFKDMESEGTIGITLNGDWCEPYDPQDPQDVAAAERCMEWQSAWFFDPIFFGDYPASMRKLVGDRLPTFTLEERELVKGSHMNVYFQNIYTAMWAQHAPQGNCGYSCDGAYRATKTRDGHDIGPKCPANEWLYMYPVGIRKFQNWISQRYQTDGRGVSIIVSENGWGESDSTGPETNLNDVQRCNYYREYIGNMSLGARQDGVDVRGYFAWSLMDNLEWADGYTTRFGLTYVDYETQERTPKLSFKWFQQHVTGLTQLPEDGYLPECEPARADARAELAVVV